MPDTTALKDPAKKVDPREVGHKPPHNEQEKIEPPGKTAEMTPKPDHGEESYKGLGRLTDKVALITGGDSGIGRAVAIAYAREGADVVISYLPEEEEDAKDTEQWITKAGRKALRIPGDIRDEQQCRQLVEKTFEQFGKLDILINNAAFQMTHESIEEFSTEEFDRTFKTNVYAMFWLCKAAVPRLKPGSVIINTASIQSYRPEPESPCVCVHEGRNRELHEGPVEDGFEAGHPSERRRAGSRLDTAHSKHDARRQGGEVRWGYVIRPSRSAAGTGSAVRVPRLERSRTTSRAKSTARPAGRPRTRASPRSSSSTCCGC